MCTPPGAIIPNIPGGQAAASIALTCTHPGISNGVSHTCVSGKKLRAVITFQSRPHQPGCLVFKATSANPDSMKVQALNPNPLAVSNPPLEQGHNPEYVVVPDPIPHQPPIPETKHVCTCGEGV